MSDVKTIEQAPIEQTPQPIPEVVQKQYDHLVETIRAYNPSADFAQIDAAFHYAAAHHGAQKRKDGSPFVTHPIAVAQIVAEELHLDSESIIAALLHDCIEDTDATYDDIAKRFSPTVADLVEGVSKLTRVHYTSKEEEQMENLRKMLMAMAKDIRVILIKIADRTHNMRTMEYQSTDKQRQKSLETMEIYAPIAHRLGMQRMKWELEDLSLKYLDPTAFNEITHSLEEKSKEYGSFMERIQKQIEGKLTEDHIPFRRVYGRMKHPYSIYRKMYAQSKTMDEVFDLFAFRVIVDTVADCYNVLGVIHDLYRPVLGRFKDYIGTPKPNGYQSLHTTVMGPDGVMFEVQIRTQEMHDIAEYGIAAHWKYKVGNSDEESELDIWLKTIKDILEHPEPNAIDFLDTIKLNLFSTEIFVFTPKGELITLPKDATALDLAFTLHSDLGFHCIAAKVNHRLVPLNQKLHSGDQVEILTSKSQTPKEEWLNFITTAKARSRLTASLRKDRRKIIAKGEKILKEFFESSHIEYNNDVVTKILSNLGIRHRDDLFYKIGNDEITPNENIKKIIKGKSQNPFMRYLKLSFGSNNGKNEQPKPVTPQQLTIDRKQTYILRDENGVKNYKVADCCCPIPGDDVLGYVEDDETVVVHKRECPVAMRLKSSFGPRLVSTQWEASESLSFPAKIEIQGIDRIGILNEITRVISNELIIDMRGLTIKANEGVFTGTVNIMVHDTRVVESLCNKLRKIKGVQKVARCKE